MFIQTEDTPNPATLKFLPGREVAGEGPCEIRSAEEAAASPLAERLFEIEGVSAVFFGTDFIAITKDGAEWAHIKPAVFGAIMEHFTSGAPLFRDGAEADAPAHAAHAGYEGDDAEVVEQIIELLDTRVRPAVAQDGGDITFGRFDGRTGTVFLHMRGACAGCPSSIMTLKSGIENLLRNYIPEVNAVEAA